MNHKFVISRIGFDHYLFAGSCDTYTIDSSIVPYSAFYRSLDEWGFDTFKGLIEEFPWIAEDICLMGDLILGGVI